MPDGMRVNAPESVASRVVLARETDVEALLSRMLDFAEAGFLA